MQGEPAKRIQKQAEVETGRHAKVIVVYTGAQVVKKSPGKYANCNVCKNVPTDMYPRLLHKWCAGKLICLRLCIINFIQNLVSHIHSPETINDGNRCFCVAQNGIPEFFEL